MTEKYAIVAKADVEALSTEVRSCLFSCLGETSLDTCRESTEGDIILKWKGGISPLTAAGLEFTELTKEQLLTEVNVTNPEIWGSIIE